MVGKAGDVVARLVGAEGIEHQVRIEPALHRRARQHAGELDAGTIGGRLRGDNVLQCADVHDLSL
jgi:hypothetical protein